jgi:uncharacterized protein involved in high-affinity Fe2+ transport
LIQTLWTHIKSGTASVVVGLHIRGREAKVGQKDVPRGRNQDVLWLEVPVVDSQPVAMFNGIQNLEEGSLN